MAVVAASGDKSGSGMNNRLGCCERESERLVVAMKRVMTVERRSLGESGADSEVRVV